MRTEYRELTLLGWLLSVSSCVLVIVFWVVVGSQLFVRGDWLLVLLSLAGSLLVLWLAGRTIGHHLSLDLDARRIHVRKRFLGKFVSWRKTYSFAQVRRVGVEPGGFDSQPHIRFVFDDGLELSFEQQSTGEFERLRERLRPLGVG